MPEIFTAAPLFIRTFFTYAAEKTVIWPDCWHSVLSVLSSDSEGRAGWGVNLTNSKEINYLFIAKISRLIKFTANALRQENHMNTKYLLTWILSICRTLRPLSTERYSLQNNLPARSSQVHKQTTDWHSFRQRLILTCKWRFRLLYKKKDVACLGDALAFWS